MSDWLRWLLIALAVLAAVAVTVGRRRPRLTLPQVRARGGIAASVLVWLVIAIVVAGGTAGGLLWFFGWPHLPTAAVFDVTQLLDLLKIALSVVAGFGGVVLLAVNYRKQRVTENEHALAVEKAERETVQGFNERLGTAAEQLAHDSPAVRLTGVYALAGLADDWEDKRQVCVDVLCGYLRIAPEVVSPGEAEVRQAVLRMFRDRLGSGGRWWQPVDFDFTGVVFENADFSRLRFPGAVIFDRADFTGELTSFERTSFAGALSCHGTHFAASRTTFARARFKGSAEFVGAEFAGGDLDCPGWDVDGRIAFYRCEIRCTRIDFSLLTIKRGEVRFERIEFADAEVTFDVSGDWENKNFSRLIFDEARFTSCRLRLQLDQDRERMIWFIDCLLDSVTVQLPELDWLSPWLNLRDVELRGGTEIPDGIIRRSAQERLDH
ncbi:hypothetical protein VA596_09135 [Amycolatopsis sp., V23-08]|uniref:Pentapeptide repeat-containing protein n=1 Tax=Amycolatopsis heterodermiae TaxID=3110235 RepID=A0ABU5R0K2_9PSEU|nr:hypothetical protein [Amycolatopsis sp., V23-08]MEA5359698.1 hypothetical protein [Amycolatopsis sp., V23-08]